MNKILVSVIVPVYNAEKTIDRCVESVLEQEKGLYELILIDDGSSDKSRSICCKYEETHDNVKVVTNSNHGVSYTRNNGLDIAKGDYIFFLDADDWIEKDTFAKVKNILSTSEFDLVFTGFHKEYKNTSVFVSTNESDIVYYENDRKEFNPYHTRLLGTVWGKFYKREFIGNERFDNALKLCEDAELNYRLFPNATKMAYMNISSYHYSYFITSAVRSYNLKQIEEYCKSIDKIKNNVKGQENIAIESATIFICNILNVIIMNHIFSVNNKNSLKMKMEELKSVINLNFFQEAINNVEMSKLPVLQKSIIVMAKKKMSLLIWLCSLLNQIRNKILYQ